MTNLLGSPFGQCIFTRIEGKGITSTGNTLSYEKSKFLCFHICEDISLPKHHAMEACRRRGVIVLLHNAQCISSRGRNFT